MLNSVPKLLCEESFGKLGMGDRAQHSSKFQHKGLMQKSMDQRAPSFPRRISEAVMSLVCSPLISNLRPSSERRARSRIKERVSLPYSAMYCTENVLSKSSPCALFSQQIPKNPPTKSLSHPSCQDEAHYCCYKLS